MESNNQELLAFLDANPKSTKEAIKIATGLNGLFLFNLIKRLVQEAKVSEVEEDGLKLYSLGDVKHEGIAPEFMKKPPAVKSTGKDNSKFSFNGQEYGKGPLVHAVVERYVKDNPDVTFLQLKEVFPDSLLYRFGIFQEVDAAKIIAKKGKRYFMKPEQQLHLKDKVVVVCNQFTLANIQPFLAIAKELGFVTE